MNQKDQVLQALRNGPAVCGTDFLEMYIPRYAARILELRQDGYRIVSRRCRRPWHHHRTAQIEYILEMQGQGRLFA